MSRAPYKIDRFATIVVALLLIFLGLVLIDWRYHLVLHSYSHRISLGPVPAWAASSWWPWVFALATLVLGLIGVWWLLAHLRTTTTKQTKMPQSDPHGTITLDTASLASAVADSLQKSGPFSSVKASTARVGASTAVLVTAHLDQHADGASIQEATRALQEQLRSAFPDQGVIARVLLDQPRSPRSDRKSDASARVPSTS
ncbi:alkaline shock response membrane anchor protein AmaP [Allobranchiibius sp. GilTou73]|uniref:alkaline shock response membrane anchor protein AmaP n=1 Tax=Allobranchiibius sp. GilTou73 TaxID=2904523 RepID=UPI001F25F2A9|nr:alkaline shock response membrane anchor protein AmaP [Allobranchiibius sp. GilTou73]UIJ35610.1 alkaline shock response membrane anchor protein AmaP [Allobranchiibius sp. GilTou73]